jgi:cytochrome c peroxidase
MHDGRLFTLEAVVEHYDAGGEGARNQHALVQPLHLSEHEKAALVAFLHSLTDE